MRKLILIQTLMGLGSRQGKEAEKATILYLIVYKTSSYTNGVGVYKLHMGTAMHPIVWASIHNRGRIFEPQCD